MNHRKVLFALIGGLACFGQALAQDAVDAKLLEEIGRIRAIDDHMHGDPVDAARSARWRDDAPLGQPRYADVVALQRTNPEWRAAWYALYGYAFDDVEPAHLRALLATKRETLAKGGMNWPSRVLDSAGVEFALLNRVKPGPGQLNGRFRWVPYADPLLRPFAAQTSWLDYSGGDLSIATLLKEAGFSRPPPTLTEYRVNIIQASLARWKKSGAVAVKFMCAYARALDFAVVEEAAAAPVYAKAVKGAEPLSAAEQKLLEDYLFGAIAAAAGAQQLVVQIHTGNGDGPYFNNSHADPGLLEDAIDSLRKTNFVLLHGGWPYHEVAQAMLDKPNTWADFSAQTFYLGTHQLAEVLRDWLSWHPEKVLFGSDAYSDVDSPLNDWEEKEFLLTGKARRALAIALTAMLQNGEITRQRALEIARQVLRDNAMKLYGLSAQ
ncbi:MAG TPA: amidohydrolase family protein [Steroidobacteraceae bacterium]|nr:amidohydrolase family protein [Steroidobacteraceae bacterium]